MNKKIAIVIIIIILIIAGIAIFEKVKESYLPDENQQTKPTAQSQESAAPAASVKTSPDAKKEIHGRVLGIGEKTLTVEQDNGSITVNINANTPVSMLKDGKETKSGLYDIKVLAGIKIQYDEATKDAEQIVIETQ